MDAQELRNLQEAYNQVYESETGRGPRLIDAYDKPPYSDEVKDAPKYKPVRKGPKMKGVIKKEEVDIYNIILSHLLDEGYAETPEAAEVIMVNMSEEWRESIVEEVLDEELTGERLKRAETKIKSLGRKKSTADARSSLFKVAYGKEGTGLPGKDGQPGGRKAPVKRGGGGTKGQPKVSGSGGDDMDRGY